MKIVWLDGEDGQRGGSIYIRRMNQWLNQRGVDSNVRELGKGYKKWMRLIRICAESWLRGYEIRATAPSFSVVGLIARKSKLYIQTPVEEWSDRSIVLTRLVKAVKRCCFVCVSATTSQSAVEHLHCDSPRVSYARLAYARHSSCDRDLENNSSDRVVCIVLDAGNVEKGFLRHQWLIRRARQSKEVIVESFGKESDAYSNLECVYSNGFIDDPMGYTRRKYPLEKIFYLGCSDYEGLHMAVIEAAVNGIPSILTDIAAHRELKQLCGSQLSLYSDARSLFGGWMNLVNDKKSYRQALEDCKRLAEVFEEFQKTEYWNEGGNRE